MRYRNKFQKKKRLSLKHALLLISLISGTAGAFTFGAGAGVLYGYGPAEGWTNASLAYLNTSVSGVIAEFGGSFNLSLSNKMEQLISAIAVATKQEALSATTVVDATHDSAEQLVNAIRATRQNDQVVKAYMDYNPALAQGYQVCNVTARNISIDKAFSDMGESVKKTLGTFDVAPGRLASSTAEAMNARLQLHRDKFCTVTEEKAGLCTASTLPGGDTNASLLFEPAKPDSLQAQARHAYIQHVLGEPDQAVNVDAGGNSAGQTYMLAKNTKDSILSIPAYSLSMIDAANTQIPEMDNHSPNEALNAAVTQYFGGKRALDWSKKLAGQSALGLLREQQKLAGLEIWLHHQQYKQNQRLELNLAALSLQQHQNNKAFVQAQHDKAVRDVSNAAIK